MIRKFKYLIYIPLMLMLWNNALSQESNNSLHLWKLHSFTGEVRLSGLYREQQRTGLDFNDSLKSTNLSGGAILRTSSSIIHQNFLLLDIDAGYMPETRKDNYVIIPDQSEVRTLKKLGINATFLQNKKVTAKLFSNFDENYSTRENLTNIRSVSRHLGSTVAYLNTFLPVTVDYHSRKWDQEEIQTGRKYKMDQNIIGARMNKSFTSHDNNEFRYSHDENVNVNQNLFRVANVNDNFDFNSHICLDTNRRYNLNTVVTSFNQRGKSNLNRLQVSEFLHFQLPANFAFTTNYSFFDIHQNQTGLLQHTLNGGLEHQLFESLQTRLNFEFNNINHTVYQEDNTKFGIEFIYTKKIPTGDLQLSYRFDRYHQNYNSDPFTLTISNEQYTLSDSRITLLRLPEVSAATVVIKDLTGTFIYESGLDYLLIDRGKYIEIRRIPGGNIANESPVLVDYLAAQPGSYKYDANTHVLTSSVHLFNNRLSFNYRYSTQDYSNLQTTDFVTLNYFTQHLVGCRIDFGFINAGADYEDYKSSILPYRMARFYVNLQKTLGNNLIAILNGNMQDYTMLNEQEPQYQKYMDATGKITWSVFKQTSINLDLMYRKQTGRGIDLDLLTSKLEMTSSFNRLYFIIGAEIYRRNYIGEKINFKGTYFKIVRKF